MKCRLCGYKTGEILQAPNRKFSRCFNCHGIQVFPEYFEDPETEKGRYLNHNNDINDERYKNFLSPVTTQIKKDFQRNSLGLDFGCGTGPVAAVELQKAGYLVNLYDPFFEYHPEVLEKTYNFIICTEVMEHFHQPHKEFALLYNLLKEGGKLYCKTSLFSDDMDFYSWYYKNDPTHTFFYTEASLKWIKEEFGFINLELQPKLIIFSK